MDRALRVGIALTTDPERARDKLGRLCRAIEAAVGTPVEARGMLHYHHLLSALEDGKLDVVWLPPLLALRATGRGLCAPMALPVRHGVSTYSTALFSRAGSPIRAVGDLTGVRAAWVDPHSASGFLVIRALLRSQGVDLATAFSQSTFYGAHDAVVKVVLAGQADVGATFVYLDSDSVGRPPSGPAGSVKRAGWEEAAVQVICVAGSIPADMVGAGPRLDAGLRAQLQAALVEERAEVALAAADLLGADGFVAPSEAHMAGLAGVLKDLEDDQPGARPYSLMPPPAR